MMRLATTRYLALSAVVLCLVAAPVSGQASPDPQGLPQHRPGRAGNFRPGGGGDHLAEWMAKHSNLTNEQQLRALEAEPGFAQLPPATQQHMRDTLVRLQGMTPERRQRILSFNEAIERLNPSQREQVRAATKQLAELPPDQRRYVVRTFRGLRQLPPRQRQAVLNSERFAHLTPEQRSSLNSLMAVEPLLPPSYDSSAPPQQQAQQNHP